MKRLRNKYQWLDALLVAGEPPDLQGSEKWNATTRAVALAITSFMDPDITGRVPTGAKGECTAATATIAARAGCSERTVQVVLAVLERVGCIWVQQGGGRKQVNAIALRPDAFAWTQKTPQEIRGNSENPAGDSENPAGDSENPAGAADNHHQYHHHYHQEDPTDPVCAEIDTPQKSNIVTLHTRSVGTSPSAQRTQHGDREELGEELGQTGIHEGEVSTILDTLKTFSDTVRQSTTSEEAERVWQTASRVVTGERVTDVVERHLASIQNRCPRSGAERLIEMLIQNMEDHEPLAPPNWDAWASSWSCTALEYRMAVELGDASERMTRAEIEARVGSMRAPEVAAADGVPF